MSNSHPFVLVRRGKLETAGVIIGLPDLALVTRVAVEDAAMSAVDVKIKGKQSIIAVNGCMIQVLKSRNNDSFLHVKLGTLKAPPPLSALESR